MQSNARASSCNANDAVQNRQSRKTDRQTANQNTTISKVSSGSGEAEHFLGIPIDELFSDEGS